ncbi:MFS transporter [Pseudonocardia sp. KRD-184]|uniref:MFS transporter n=1 Tax=Pseudonocardia oceani TaxID=2792013 RepID=A0ABS6UGK7_9PSEU|nr:MFS transporter [Pseudonocardia oceani]MBW0092776.1 MFS transporter [Pseudonocardia oceani]MBW0099564.1 MFS transporter [Pseudonocardia oceani]MBW0112222.1 MFS transporter [Pseudonocardia oceani]MBW0121190.1 MFS transporter [Pseudonocardia oceani]MBW0130994.1 MFS transporter [Pseudonocardia oceani]
MDRTVSTTTGTPPGPPAGLHPGGTLAITAGGTLLSMTAFTAPFSIIPTVARDLGAGPVATSWVLSSMSLGLAVALLTSGAIGDEVGRRRVFVAGAALLAVGSAACALAPDAWTFVVGRVLEGIGSAAVIACGLALISHTFPGPERARATGIWGASMGAGPALGPPLGAVLAAVADWRLAFVVVAVLSVLLAVAGQRLLTESRSGRGRRADVTGALLLAVGTGALLAGLTEGRRGWTSPLALGLVVGAVVVLAVFVVHQRRVREPMLELGMFRRPALVSATFAAFVTGAAIIALMSFVAVVLESGLGYTSVQASVIGIAWSGFSVAFALLARRIPLRVSGAVRLAAGLLTIALGLLPLALLTTGAPLAQLLVGLVVAGVGSGIVNATLAREAVAGVPATSAGAGSGINNSSRYIGAAFGVTVVTALAVHPDGTAAGLVAGWNTAVLVGIALSVLGAVVVLLLQRAETRYLAAVAA